MGPTVLEDFAGNELTIQGMNTGDIVGSESPEATNPIFILVELGTALLAGEEGGGSPRSAPEDTGGFIFGDHGGKLAVIGGRADILGFVHGEEGGGGGTDGLGDRTAAEEMDTSLIQADDKTVLALPASGGEGIAVEAALKATDGIASLRNIGGGNGDDLDLLSGEKAEQVGLDVGLGLILAGLAGED
jgi:hypothetical protein